MCATRSQRADDVLRQPVALGADEQRHAGAPRRSPAPRSALARRRARARRARPAARPARATRASATAKIAPMLARTAFGAVGVGAAAARARRSEAPKALRGAHAPCRRCRGRRRRAGTRTAAPPARPSAARRRRSRACRSRAWRRSPSSVALDVEEARAAERRVPGQRGSPRAPRDPAGVGRRDEILALGHERAAARALALGVQLAQRLQVGVVWEVMWSWCQWCDGTKKGRRPFQERRPGGCRCRCVRPGQAADASRAASAKRRKVSASRTAMSASTLRSSSTPASERPCMNCE